MSMCENDGVRGGGVQASRVRCTRIVPVLVAALLLASAAWGQSTQPSEQKAAVALAQQMQASCVLKITCDPTVLALDAEVVQTLISTTGIAPQSFFEVVKPFHPDAPPDEMVVDFSGMDGREGRHAGRADTVLGVFIVESAYGGAPQIMERICARLQTALEAAWLSDVDSLSSQIKIAAGDADEAEHRLIELQKYRSDWCTKHGRNDLSREILLGQSTELEKEKERLEMELAGLQARRDALQQRIAEVGHRVTTSAPTDDAVVRALRTRITALRRRQADLRDVDPGLEAELALAEAELAGQIQKAAGGDTLVRLNDELADVSIETTQKVAQLEQVRKQLANLGDVLRSADEYERKVGVLLPLAKKMYQEAIERRQTMQRARDALPRPKVTVLGVP